MEAALNGDLTRYVSVDTTTLEWAPSPSGTVFRKRVHRVGPAESGQVTSVVRYEADASFHAHGHPDGEEILVLDGVFSDEHGDWPKGAFLLNPEGFRHAPFSKDGCLLLVKLRQYPGEARIHVALNTSSLPWVPTTRAGVARKTLYEQSGFKDTIRLERWAAGTVLDTVTYPGGAEIFVMDGGFVDEHGAHRSGTWCRFPVGASHHPRTETGCTVYLKEGGLAYLESAVRQAGIVQR